MTSEPAPTAATPDPIPRRPALCPLRTLCVARARHSRWGLPIPAGSAISRSICISLSLSLSSARIRILLSPWVARARPKPERLWRSPA